MKGKHISLLSLMLCVCVILSSCGSALDTVENFCFAVKDLDMEKMAKYTVDDAEKYFENVMSYWGELSEDQKSIVKELFAYVSFTDIAEENEGVFTLKVKAVDFSSLISSVEISLAAGTDNASDYIREIIDGGSFKGRFLKAEQGVTVIVSDTDDGYKITLGHSGKNKEFTALLGLDLFLRWYSTQR